VSRLDKRWKWTGLLAAVCSLMLVLASPAHAASKAGAKSDKSNKAVSSARQAKPGKATKSAKAGKAAKAPKAVRTAGAKRVAPARAARVAPARLSYGMVYGLHDTEDPLDLKSSVALVIDQDTNEVLFSKNPQAVLPVASITKLMTALVVIESGSSLEAPLTVSQDDVDTEKGSGSRLRVGTELSRGEMLHLALMSSENRAAHALGRHHPGGMAAFVDAMNRKARELGMFDTRYVEPTGLSSANQSSAHDLTLLVKAASQHSIIRELSTSLETQVAVGKRQLQYRNTNGLVRNPEWDIGLQKTGYISEAGRCVVMQAQLAGRTLIMVLLDSAGKYSRIGDAERLRKWLADSHFAEALAPLPSFK
jgi:D-alanyl-D-alanine endopeptidase (penicillin-binding protein 7)